MKAIGVGCATMRILCQPWAPIAGQNRRDADHRVLIASRPLGARPPTRRRWREALYPHRIAYDCHERTTLRFPVLGIILRSAT